MPDQQSHPYRAAFRFPPTWGRPRIVATRADLVHRIAEIVRQRGLQPVQVAGLAGIDAGMARSILGGRTTGVSHEQLDAVLTAVCRRTLLRGT